MGLIARYLDALPDHSRDRVIEGQEWGIGSLVDASGKRCLLGHAEDWEYAGSLFRNFARDQGMQRWRVYNFGPGAHLEIGRRFDTLAHRHGLANVVRWVKGRAGRPNLPDAVGKSRRARPAGA